MFKSLNLSWNDNGEYVLSFGDTYYSFNETHLKYWLKHLLEIIKEIKEE